MLTYKAVIALKHGNREWSWINMAPKLRPHFEPITVYVATYLGMSQRMGKWWWNPSYHSPIVLSSHYRGSQHAYKTTVLAWKNQKVSRYMIQVISHISCSLTILYYLEMGLFCKATWLEINKAKSFIRFSNVQKFQEMTSMFLNIQCPRIRIRSDISRLK